MGLDKRYIYVGATLVIIIFGVSMYLYPEWGGAWWLLIIAVIVGCVAFISNFRQAFEKKEKHFDPSTDQLAEIETIQSSDGIVIQDSSAGGDVIAVTAGTVQKIHTQVNYTTLTISEKKSATNIEDLVRVAGRFAHQVPPPPTNFVGREDDIEEIIAWVVKDNVNIIGLFGMGGVGKTSLALKLVELLTDRFRETQIFLDMRGMSNRSLSSSDAKSQIIKSLTPETSIDDLVDPSPIYYSILEGKRVIILLDNVANEDQIDSLLPNKESIIIVTSRNVLSLPAIKFKIIKTLTPQDAEKLLININPSIKKFSKKIAELCGYLPLALQLAGTNIIKYPALTPEEYIMRLENMQSRLKLTGVDASIKLSYDLLTKELREFWACLSVFIEPFDRIAVTNVTGLPTSEVPVLLSELVTRSLLEVDRVPNFDTSIPDDIIRIQRYRMHELFRIFARNLDFPLYRHSQNHYKQFVHEQFISESLQKIKGHNKTKAQLRYCYFYMNNLYNLNEQYERGGAEAIQSLNLLDRRMPNIVHAQSTAMSCLDKNKAASAICSGMADASGSILTLRQNPLERINWQQIGLSAAINLEDYASQGIHLLNLGEAYHQIGEYTSSLDSLQKALQCFSDLDDRKNKSNAYRLIGSVYEALAYYGDALKFNDQALSTAEGIDYRRGEGYALINLGLLCIDQGNANQSLEYFNRAMTIFTSAIDEKRGQSIIYGYLGIAHVSIGNYEEAIRFYNKQTSIARALGDQLGEGNALCNLAAVHNILKDFDISLTYSKNALAIFEELHNRRDQINALTNVGVSFHNLGNISSAFDFYQRADEIATLIKDQRGKAIVCWNIGLLYEEKGEFKIAKEYMQPLVEFENHINHPDLDVHRKKIELLQNKLLGQTGASHEQ